MNNKAKRRGAVGDLKATLTHFGHNICGDHCIMAYDGWDTGYDGSTVGFLLHDLFSGFTDLYGQKSKSAQDNYESMNDFADSSWVNKFYSDRSRELKKAAKWLVEPCQVTTRHAANEPYSRAANLAHLQGYSKDSVPGWTTQHVLAACCSLLVLPRQHRR